MKVKLFDCVEHDYMYGILEVENKSVEEIQDMLYKIKKDFERDGKIWFVDDVFDKFPSDWIWKFEQINDIVTI